MALINCPECKKEISDQSINCPNCGYPMKSLQDEHLKTENKISFNNIWNKLSIYERISAIALIVFILMTIVALVAGKTASAIFSIISIVLVVISYFFNYYKSTKIVSKISLTEITNFNLLSPTSAESLMFISTPVNLFFILLTRPSILPITSDLSSSFFMFVIMCFNYNIFVKFCKYFFNFLQI